MRENPREERRQTAQDRQERWERLDPRQRLDNLDRRLGAGQGARRQRAKLARQIEKLAEVETKGQKKGRRRATSIQDLVKAVKKAGWNVEITGGTHYAFKNPEGGATVYGSYTPSDSHSVKNMQAELRRKGLDI